MKDEYKKMRSHSSKSDFRSSMLNKFIKSFQSKYKLNDFGKRSSSDQKMSDNPGGKGTSKYDSSSSVISESTKKIKVLSPKPPEKKKNRLSF